MDGLIQQSRMLLRQLDAAYRRSFHLEVDWDWRLVGILGARGVGKTTMLLQQASRFAIDEAIYLSLDDLYFSKYTVKETVEQLAERGYVYFFLDEVHKYPTWSREIKNLYDFYPGLKIAFTGSSIIELYKQQVDLSRRALIYHMPVLSFREYLGLRNILELPALTLTELLDKHEELAYELTGQFKPIKHFNDYLQYGAYPFFLEGTERYALRLKQLTQLVIESDLAAGADGPVKQPHKLKQLVQVLADSVPFTPNISKLAQKIELDRNTLLRYLNILQQVRLVNMIYPPGKGSSVLQKPSRLYLENSNLAYALSTQNPERGNLRETFFLNQVQRAHRVNSHPKTDFLVDGKWSFEIGGKGKTRRQLEGVPDSYVVVDGVSMGSRGRVPLWMFGLLG